MGKIRKTWRRYTSILLTLLLICVSLPTFAAGTVNLVAGLTPEQSKASTSTGSPSSVTDGVKGSGDSGTAWTTRSDYHYSATDPMALIFDLGEPKKVGKVVVTGSTNYTSTQPYYALPANYDISYSTDKSTWVTAKQVRDNADYACTSEFSNIEAQ